MHYVRQYGVYDSFRFLVYLLHVLWERPILPAELELISRLSLPGHVAERREEVIQALGCKRSLRGSQSCQAVLAEQTRQCRPRQQRREDP